GVAGGDAAGEIFVDLGATERRGEEDTRGLALAIELGDGEEIFFGERIVGRQLGATAAGETELTDRAAALRDAIGIGEGEHAARLGRIDALVVFDMELALDLARGIASAL